MKITDEDNRPTRSTQVFKIKARLRVNTTSALRDLIVTDDGICQTGEISGNTQGQIRDSQEQ